MPNLRSLNHIIMKQVYQLVQFLTNENPGINLENGLSSEQSKKNSKKLSLLPAKYVNIKQIFTLVGNPDKHLLAPLCSINFEDMLNFSNFDIAFDEDAMLSNHFLLMLKIPSILDGKVITHISIVDLNRLRESTLFFR